MPPPIVIQPNAKDATTAKSDNTPSLTSSSSVSVHIDKGWLKVEAHGEGASAVLFRDSPNYQAVFDAGGQVHIKATGKNSRAVGFG
jgi:hypothetical protein